MTVSVQNRLAAAAAVGVLEAWTGPWRLPQEGRGQWGCRRGWGEGLRQGAVGMEAGVRGVRQRA